MVTRLRAVRDDRHSRATEHREAMADPARARDAGNGRPDANGRNEPRDLLEAGTVDRDRPRPLLRRHGRHLRVDAARRARAASPAGAVVLHQPALRAFPDPGPVLDLLPPLLHLHAHRQDDDQPRRRQLRREHGRCARAKGRRQRDGPHPQAHRVRPAVREGRRQTRTRCADGRTSRHRQDDAREGDRLVAPRTDLHRGRRFVRRHVPRHRRAERLPDGPRRPQAGEDLGRLHRLHRRDRRPRPGAVGHWRRRDDGRHGRNDGRWRSAGAKHAAGPDGRHRQPGHDRPASSGAREPHARWAVPAPRHRIQRHARSAAHQGAQSSELQHPVHRRDQPAVGAGRGLDPAGTIRPPDHLPPPQPRGPQGHRGPLLRQEAARPRPRHSKPSRRVRTHHRGLLARRHRAGAVAVLAVRVRGRTRRPQLERHTRSDGQRRGWTRHPCRVHRAGQDRGRATRARARGRISFLQSGPCTRAALDPAPRHHAWRDRRLPQVPPDRGRMA